MVSVLWSNGQLDSAPTWDELLEKIRQEQPRSYTPLQFRRELRRRVQLWSGMRVDVELPAAKLFQELEYAKVVVITERTEES